MAHDRTSTLEMTSWPSRQSTVDAMRDARIPVVLPPAAERHALLVKARGVKARWTLPTLRDALRVEGPRCTPRRAKVEL